MVVLASIIAVANSPDSLAMDRYVNTFMVLTIALWIAIVVGYWVPGFIAFRRHHPNRVAILGLNIVLGWTVIGWIAALLWALSSKDAPAPTVMVPAQGICVQCGAAWVGGSFCSHCGARRGGA